MKQSTHHNAPIEFCRTSSLYPFYLYVFKTPAHESREIVPRIIPRHWHQDVEITYRLRYKGTLYINGKSYPLTDDSMHIINSCDIHEIHSESQTERYAVLVSISYDFLKKIVPDIDHYHLRAGAHTVQMKEIILKMKKEQENTYPYSYLLQNSLIYELIYYMMKDAVPLDHASLHPISHKNLIHKKEIIEYLNNHITEISSVQQLSNAFGYSREYFSRMVRDYFGISCQQLLTETRLSLAVRLMTETSDSLPEIASKTGFPSVRTFLRNFRRYYGENPESFLKNRL